MRNFEEVQFIMMDARIKNEKSLVLYQNQNFNGRGRDSMKKGLSTFVVQQGIKEIVDPVTDERMIFQVIGQEVHCVHQIAGTEDRSILQVDELKERILMIYERFQEQLPCYLTKIREEKKIWCFFDIAFGVNIVVKGKFLDNQFICWEIWMDDDLAFTSNLEEEMMTYLRGLVIQVDSWVLNQLFEHFHENFIRTRC